MQTPTTNSAFLTLAASADYIGATRRFLERRIADGEIAVFRPSARLVRIRKSELERWISTYTIDRKEVGA